MYIMYVDESGDPGIVNSPTKYFILSALVVHESSWKRLLDESIDFRRVLKKDKGLLMRQEIHASEFISKRITFKKNISRNDRLDILKRCIDWLKQLDYIEILTVKIDKSRNQNPFDAAWQLLIQRFENTLRNDNFVQPSFKSDTGIIVCDNTDSKKLTGIVRKMRRINFIPSMFGTGSRNIPLVKIIKDPIFRESSNSYIIQLVDVVAYFAKQYFDPNKYIRKKAGRNYYGRLIPVINKKVKYSSANFYIVEQ